MFKKPLFNVSFAELEKQTLEFWKVENILQKSIDTRPADKPKPFMMAQLPPMESRMLDIC